MPSCCAPGHEPADLGLPTLSPPSTLLTLQPRPVPTPPVPTPPVPTPPEPAPAPALSPAAVRAGRGLLELPGGAFRMGGQDPDGIAGDGEGPVREVLLGPFAIAATTVSNAEFASFVRETGYVTDAERFGSSFVFEGFLPERLRARSPRVAATPWWRAVEGAAWRTPEGPGSGFAARQQHPVVHVSWNDAQAYCAWSGTRLPTEAQWEYAARGGSEGTRYPWGDELAPGGRELLNIWQGDFPTRNTGRHRSTAPVRSYRPNGHGLYNVLGNVWEWCADHFSPDHHRPDTPATRQDPLGPPTGTARVMRGGSHMCHASYCNRYRLAARSSNTPDSSSGNIGFRVAR
ncbi:MULTISPECIES: formylglycine-generating enzyme family protein [Kitasatospora]|uniref:Putative sulfatase-modifying factor n=1 Tax=Kitasatospora setae (strain ATCC 33774 / DSM 43861 / JCM 3304 / KCC A-0304 / NBRC 14216 / KM-6054) TaxID=452652 RepID=E4NIZ8_KITSK|nr:MULTISPECIES: formylglycine-generating enzyme family protein [Kitasatospora]BAJ32946.1 putative sulfatase-modifying factor [Kitasatospora setae KM-6054]